AETGLVRRPPLARTDRRADRPVATEAPQATLTAPIDLTALTPSNLPSDCGPGTFRLLAPDVKSAGLSQGTTTARAPWQRSSSTREYLRPRTSGSATEPVRLASRVSAIPTPSKQLSRERYCSRSASA